MLSPLGLAHGARHGKASRRQRVGNCPTGDVAGDMAGDTLRETWGGCLESGTWSREGCGEVFC